MSGETEEGAGAPTAGMAATASGGYTRNVNASIVRAMLFTLIPVAAAASGAIAAAVRPPQRKLTSALQHAAAGVVFAAVALELIPEIRAQAPWSAIVGFTVGIAAMSGLSAVTRSLEHQSRPGRDAERGIGAKAGLIAATGIDLLIDGVVLGAGFAAAEKSGVLLTIALTLELVLIGLSNAGALAEAGVRPVLSVATITGLGLLSTLGTGIGVAVLGGAPSAVLSGMLAFGAVALMYLVTEELLVEAHEVPDTYWATAAFFVGFLCDLVVTELMAP